MFVFQGKRITRIKLVYQVDVCIDVCVLMMCVCVDVCVCKEKDLKEKDMVCVCVCSCVRKKKEISCVRVSGKEDNPNNPGVSG